MSSVLNKQSRSLLLIRVISRAGESSMKTTELNKYTVKHCASVSLCEKKVVFLQAGCLSVPQGTWASWRGEENSANRSRESLVYLTVNTVWNQQLVLVAVSLLQELNFFPFPAPLELGYLDVASGQHVIHIILQQCL